MKFKSLQFIAGAILSLTAGTLIAQPANNSCAGAIDIQSAFGNTVGTTTTLGPYDNTTATVDPTDPTMGFECFGEPDGSGTNPTIENTLWFSFTGDGGKYFIETGNGPGVTNYIDDGDTQIAIYTGACGALVPFACNEDGPSSTATTYPAGITINTSVGVVYYMMIDGFNFSGVLSTGEFLVFVTQQASVACTDPTVTLGTASSNTTAICAGDTAIFSISGVITPTVGAVSGLGWLISNADLFGNSDPLNDPSVVAGYAVQNPAPSTSSRAYINDGVLIGGAVPYGIYYWTPVIFGNATIGTPPGTFITQLVLDVNCTTTGASLPVTVYAPGDPACSVGLADIKDNGFGIYKLYPVPVSSELHFNLKSVENGSVQIVVSDLTGRQVMSQFVRTVPGEKSVTINVNEIAAGVYNLSAISGNNTSIVKFVKQ